MDGTEGQRGKHKIQPTPPLQLLFLDGTAEIAHLKVYLELLQNNKFHTHVHRSVRKTTSVGHSENRFYSLLAHVRTYRGD
jgi:hypothetical protein